MIDPSQILLTGLVPALQTATGLTVYSQLPKEAEITYPYIWISDIYIDENGPKDAFFYSADVLIQVVFKQELSLIPFLTAKDGVMSIINNDVPFALSGGHKILECTLNNNTTTQELNDIGNLNIGLIRAVFLIE